MKLFFSSNPLSSRSPLYSRSSFHDHTSTWTWPPRNHTNSPALWPLTPPQVKGLQPHREQPNPCTDPLVHLISVVCRCEVPGVLEPIRSRWKCKALFLRLVLLLQNLVVNYFLCVLHVCFYAFCLFIVDGGSDKGEGLKWGKCCVGRVSFSVFLGGCLLWEMRLHSKCIMQLFCKSSQIYHVL